MIRCQKMRLNIATFKQLLDFTRIKTLAFPQLGLPYRGIAQYPYQTW